MPNAVEIGGYMQVRGQSDPTVTDQKRDVSSSIPAAGQHHRHAPVTRKKAYTKEQVREDGIADALQGKCNQSQYVEGEGSLAVKEKQEGGGVAARVLAKACTADVPKQQPQLCRTCIRSVAPDFPCLWLKR